VEGPKAEPQFAQNFAASGFDRPQFGQCMVKPTVTDRFAQKAREYMKISFPRNYASRLYLCRRICRFSRSLLSSLQ
jgi:hypothetical protein